MGDSRPVRFIVVGVLNTAIDFGILLLLTSLGMGMFLANVISTSTAFGFSFVANRSFTFRSSGDARVQIVKFAAVTLVGLWLLQPLVIWGTMLLVSGVASQSLALLLGKACATVVSMLWNYILYARYVFVPVADSREVRE
ncbi:GtrA family protein [Microbacterium sp.]|uniref:GtrA family protein n=1 Tax=Microbacterium sp. TaxID=51671 RepID=UPI002810FDF8|nr:GtrA family protein [Microbacterium sp.]